MKKHLTHKLTVILLVAVLAMSLVAVAACDNTPNHGDNTSVPELAAEFDNSHTVYSNDKLDDLKPYFTVTYTDENGQAEQVTDFILIGSLVVGDSKIAVNYQDLTAIVTVKVLKANVQPDDPVYQPKLEAIFDNSHLVYHTDSLDSLKPYFTVTYTDEKGQATQVTDFILIGSLVVGDSKIAVNYNDLTVIVTVQVLSSVEPDNPDNPPEPTTKPTLTAELDTNHVVYETDSTESLRPFLTVIYTDENGQATQVTDYILLGSLIRGDSIIAVNYQGLFAYLTVTVVEKPSLPPEELQNPELKATFDTTRTVYEGDSLNSLKEYLTVTYTNAYGVASQVNDYRLIGSLDVGENLIGVIYANLTAIVTINVVKKPTVTFVADSNVVAVKTYTKYNLSVQEPAVPAKTGYTGVWEDYVLTEDTGDITVNAVYTAKTYTVTFDYNGADGNVTVQTMTVTYNEPIGNLPEPTRTDHVFIGWYRYETLINSGDKWNHPYNSTLIARWETSQYDFNGLQYRLSDDGTSYYVVGYDDSVSSVLIIPQTFAGKPVTVIYHNAFENCDALTHVVLHDNITQIGLYAFSGCSQLESIDMGTGIKSIGYKAFEACVKLTAIVIPASVETIGYPVLANCPSLESITVADGNEFYHSDGNCLIKTSTATLINGCKNSVIPTDGSVKIIGEFAFDGCLYLTQIDIPDTVTKIQRMAFRNCVSLKSIVIPDSVGGTLYDYVFSGCTSLENVTLSNNLLAVTFYVFENCVSLKSITIPEHMRVISGRAFYGCSNLKSITILGGRTSRFAVGPVTFEGCDKLSAVYFEGTEEEWNSIADIRDPSLENVTVYFYSAEAPELNEDGTGYDGNYWHWDADLPAKWRME